MPSVTGELRSILGQSLASSVGTIVFRLNTPQVNANGGIFPTKHEEVIPGADAKFDISLATTTTMQDDAWYEIGIVWQGEKEASWDFPTWRVRVPPEGGILADLIDRSPAGGAPGFQLVWVGPEAPRLKWRGLRWLQLDPINESASSNSGDLFEWE